MNLLYISIIHVLRKMRWMIVISSAMSRHLGTNSLAVGVCIMVIWAINWMGSLQQQNRCSRFCGVLSLLSFIGRAIEKNNWIILIFVPIWDNLLILQNFFKKCHWKGGKDIINSVRDYFLIFTILCFKQIFKIWIFVDVVSSTVFT